MGLRLKRQNLKIFWRSLWVVMMRLQRALADRWTNTTLYDLPGNLARRIQLTPIAMKLSPTIPTPKSSLRFLPDSTTAPAYGLRRNVTWESRTEEPLRQTQSIQSASVPLSIDVGLRRTVVPVNRSPLKVDLPKPKPRTSVSS
jgi:hypothetical protein